MIRKTLFALVLMTTLTASAQGRRPLQFYWENDIGVLTKGTDEYYTNGLRFSVGAAAPPPWSERFLAGYCGLRLQPCKNMISETSQPQVNVAYAFTHQFWTPQNKLITAPQPLDRPWAGYMYGSVNAQIVDERAEREQHVFELQFGILGQGAGAQTVQRQWHKLIDVDEPLGWRNQLENEPVINLLYTRNIRRGSPRADFIVSPGFVIGSLMTYPSVGLTGRIGRNITGFPAAPLAPAANRGVRERASFEWYFHGGIEARWMIHNATLDGGFFRDGPSVDRRAGVFDVRGGVSVRFLNNWRVTGTIIRRSEEFTPPPGRDDGAHFYNSLMIGYEPR